MDQQEFPVDQENGNEQDLVLYNELGRVNTPLSEQAYLDTIDSCPRPSEDQDDAILFDLAFDGVPYDPVEYVQSQTATYHDPIFDLLQYDHVEYGSLRVAVQHDPVFDNVQYDPVELDQHQTTIAPSTAHVAQSNLYQNSVQQQNSSQPMIPQPDSLAASAVTGVQAPIAQPVAKPRATPIRASAAAQSWKEAMPTGPNYHRRLWDACYRSCTDNIGKRPGMNNVLLAAWKEDGRIHAACVAHYDSYINGIKHKSQLTRLQLEMAEQAQDAEKAAKAAFMASAGGSGSI